ncbi:PREDICTED: uncharacterized protein LOC106903907 [Poecilia mexicana]|uniref:uncharacterized protein LOC106903907 n=1 Tax=Poecilia mexicana TaxID=48701 RepID=UPI00072E8E09|nr:PREDICTED: uncharacterized protein LOC106903907 [Poecilia mexicana]
MLTNSSSSTFCSFNASLHPITFSCFSNINHVIHYYCYTLTNLLILPLYLFIFWMGFQRRRSNRPAAGQNSHTDVFTYWMGAAETLSSFGFLSFSFGVGTCRPAIMVFGYHLISFTAPAQTVFHCLTCIERYLAVVHPIIYMKLKKSQGTRVRNVCIAVGCLLSFVMFALVPVFYPHFPTTVYFTIFAFIIMTMSFCSLAVFCVLITPGMKTDQTKWRAFHTILAITVALVLRISGQSASMAILHPNHRVENHCAIFLTGFWFCLPSSLVLPLLFLHRNGKLTCQE